MGNDARDYEMKVKMPQTTTALYVHDEYVSRDFNVHKMWHLVGDQRKVSHCVICQIWQRKLEVGIITAGKAFQGFHCRYDMCAYCASISQFALQLFKPLPCPPASLAEIGVIDNAQSFEIDRNPITRSFR